MYQYLLCRSRPKIYTCDTESRGHGYMDWGGVWTDRGASLSSWILNEFGYIHTKGTEVDDWFGWILNFVFESFLVSCWGKCQQWVNSLMPHTQKLKLCMQANATHISSHQIDDGRTSIERTWILWVYHVNKIVSVSRCLGITNSNYTVSILTQKIIQILKTLSSSFISHYSAWIILELCVFIQTSFFYCNKMFICW